MAVTIPRTSLEYVYIPNVQAFRAGVVTDPTTLTVQVALLPVAQFPAAADWKAASWVAGAATPTVQFLVGPTSNFVLAPIGDGYSIWLKVLGATEVPTRPVGRLVIA